MMSAANGETLSLPKPFVSSEKSLNRCLMDRRSRRRYTAESLTLQEVSSLLFAADGITNARGFRTAPSAGATFPMEIYIYARYVDSLEKGVYHYLPQVHSIEMIKKGDISRMLSKEALEQKWVANASMLIIIAAQMDRTVSVYGERGYRYVYMEAGHIGQNIYLEAEELGLGTAGIGAFQDNEIKKVLGIDESPLYIFPIGRRR